jgi:hypothetical protein
MKERFYFLDVPINPGIFALNLLVRAASVVNHLRSKSLPARKKSIHVGVGLAREKSEDRGIFSSNV